MSRRNTPKYKVYSKLGISLTNHPKLSSGKLSAKKWQNVYSSSRRPRKESEYGVLLQAKQRLSHFYGGIKANQLNRDYKRAKSFTGNQTINFIKLIERRLDVILYRCKFAPSFHEIRQLIQHGHILLNGSTVKSSSHRLVIGDRISIKLGSEELIKRGLSKSFNQNSTLKRQQKVLSIGDILENKPLLALPNFVEFNYQLLEGKVISLPDTTDILYSMDPRLTHLMEYYKYKKKL